MSAFRPLHNLFENALNGQAGVREVYTMAVHQLKKGMAGPVDISDSLQID
jgi:hypothetical protein